MSVWRLRLDECLVSHIKSELFAPRMSLIQIAPARPGLVLTLPCLLARTSLSLDECQTTRTRWVSDDSDSTSVLCLTSSPNYLPPDCHWHRSHPLVPVLFWLCRACCLELVSASMSVRRLGQDECRTTQTTLPCLLSRTSLSLDGCQTTRTRWVSDDSDSNECQTTRALFAGRDCSAIVSMVTGPNVRLLTLLVQTGSLRRSQPLQKRP